MDKLINNKKMVIMIVAVIAGLLLIFGVAMMIVTASGGETSEKSKKETTEEVAESAGSSSIEEGETINKLVISNIREYSDKVYSCKVDDPTNTSAVAILLESMGVEDVAGKYTVEIAPEGDITVLTITAEPLVKAETKRAYDSNMEILAQQLLALMPEVDQITWTYPVTGTGDKQEKASVSVSVEAASNVTDSDIRSCGESQKAFENLVKSQMKKL